MNAILQFPLKENTMTMSYEDDFEMLILRHEYIKKIPNPELVDISKHSYLSKITANIMYNKCRATFEKVGFDLEDVESITDIYLLSYVGVYSFAVNSISKDRFLANFESRFSRQPTNKELDKAERNNIINFLRQKLHHCSRVCERKSRNIVGSRTKKHVFAYTKDSVPAHPTEITQDYKKYGYRKVTKVELTEAKERAKNIENQELLDSNGFRIMEINDYSMNTVSLSYTKESDENDTLLENYAPLVNLVDMYTDDVQEYLSNPEEVLLNKQDDLTMSMDVDFFNRLDFNSKKDMLKKFVTENKSNRRLSEELKTARKMLKNSGII